MMGIGISTGEEPRAGRRPAGHLSQLAGASIAGASRVLFSIAGGPDLTLTEVSEAARTVEACADENANIIYGQIIDEELKDAVRITVIATGFKVGAPVLPRTSAPRMTCSPPLSPRPSRFSRRRSPSRLPRPRAASRTRTTSPTS